MTMMVMIMIFLPTAFMIFLPTAFIQIYFSNVIYVFLIVRLILVISATGNFYSLEISETGNNGLYLFIYFIFLHSVLFHIFKYFI